MVGWESQGCSERLHVVACLPLSLECCGARPFCWLWIKNIPGMTWSSRKFPLHNHSDVKSSRRAVLGSAAHLLVWQRQAPGAKLLLSKTHRSVASWLLEAQESVVYTKF